MPSWTKPAWVAASPPGPKNLWAPWTSMIAASPIRRTSRPTSSRRCPRGLAGRVAVVPPSDGSRRLAWFEGTDTDGPPGLDGRRGAAADVGSRRLLQAYEQRWRPDPAATDVERPFSLTVGRLSPPTSRR